MGDDAFSPYLELGVAGRPYPGERLSGDGYVAVRRGDTALLGVIDGLGHGPEAATAMEAARASLALGPDEPLPALFARCHEAIRHTRGAAITLVSLRLSLGEISWLGVGNVEGAVFRAPDLGQKEMVRQVGGVVGYLLPSLRPTNLALAPGDVLILATDGVASRFVQDVTPEASPYDQAMRILGDAARANDDALVLVARYRGGMP